MKCELCGRKQLCDKCDKDKAALKVNSILIRNGFARLNMLRQQYAEIKLQATRNGL